MITKLLFFSLATLLAFEVNAFASGACRQAYTKLYANPELKIAVFFGYGDGDDLVTDPQKLREFLEKITANCSGGSHLCGFTRDAVDIEKFYKMIPGPDRIYRKVTIKATDSALSTFHYDNITALKDQQQKKSKATAERFKNSLQNDDVVFYSGHARHGTGLAFKPLSTRESIKEMSDKTPFRDMINTLKKSKTKPKIIGIFSCDGEAHYGRPLQEVAPQTSLILTRQTMASHDTTSNMISSLNSLLEMQCEADFRRGLELTTTIHYTGPLQKKTFRESIPEIYGFFEPMTKKLPQKVSLPFHLLNYHTLEETNSPR